MRHTLFGLFLLACMAGNVIAQNDRHASAQRDRVSLKAGEGDSVQIQVDGKPFAVYRLNKSGKLPKPFLLPLRSAGGTVLTRALENPKDHPHHKGVWVSVDKVNDVDFWAEKGRIVTRSAEVLHKHHGLKVTNEWQNLDGEAIVDEVTTITVLPNHTLSYDIRFVANHGSVTFGDTKEGLFGFRMVDSLREKETGKVINADGKQGTGQCWGQPSNWVDYYGKVSGNIVGVALFDHPKNMRKSRYHVRNYGLFSVSPFGEKAYSKGKSPAKPVTLEAGKTLRLRYALYVHDGDTATGKVADAYKTWLRQTADAK